MFMGPDAFEVDLTQHCALEDIAESVVVEKLVERKMCPRNSKISLFLRHSRSVKSEMDLV